MTKILNSTVVIDNGSGTIKAGYGGDDLPKVVFPNIIGRPKHKKIMTGPQGSYFIGKQANDLRGVMKIKYPMKHGIIEDITDMEKVWNHLFENELCTQKDDHPVLLTECPLNPSKNREKISEIFFENLGVPALFITLQAMLGLYAVNKTTGIVLDVGDGVSHCVPIYDGYSINNGIDRNDIGGRDITNYLKRLLRQTGYTFNSTSEWEIVREIKEKSCYIAKDYKKEIEKQSNLKKRQLSISVNDDISSQLSPKLNLNLNLNGLSPQNSKINQSLNLKNNYRYKLPDGSFLNLGNEQFVAPEILFKPFIFGYESSGIHQMVINSINSCDMDIRQSLFSNIIISGGSTLFQGFGDRMFYEIKNELNKGKNDRDTQVKMFSPPERKYITWIGGSILSSLQSFEKMYVSKNEYEEYGPKIVHQKTL